MNSIIIAIFLIGTFAGLISYSITGYSFAQNTTADNNITSQENGTGPITSLTNQVEDVFNGTNQTSGPISEFGETLKEKF
ncbi:MAG: hypothetical protein L0H53_12105 [Candidatus Nitrosocosmicus sp.]|nr:hypothetical protein [Candidatus Nitrosocosmicus sp.]